MPIDAFEEPAVARLAKLVMGGFPHEQHKMHVRSAERACIALFLGCGLLLIFLLSASPSKAETAPAPAVIHYKFDIHFVIGDERHPVQYELDHGVLLFRARIDGKDVWATFDNRSNDSLIDAQFARVNGFTLGPRIGPVHTPTGTMERRRIQDVPVTIPGQMSFRAPLSAVDLSFVSKFVGKPVSLVIGQEYFENLGFLIDSRNRNFQLGPSGSLTVPPTIPYAVLLNDRPQVGITINGHPAVVTVDLGYNGFVALNHAAWTRFGLEDSPFVEQKTAHFEGHIHEVKSVNAHEISLGPADLHNVNVELEESLPGDQDGIIGLGFLSKFIFSIDEKSRRIWFISGV
jgi:hypothetical protein